MSDNSNPAFPGFSYYRGIDGDFHAEPSTFSGMTLRQWYAGMAMQAYVGAWEKNPIGPSREAIAEWSFAMADAMLAADLEGEQQ